MTEKRCPKCGIIKSSNTFYRDKTTLSGFTCWCKECIKRRARRQYRINSEKIKENHRHQYKVNPEKGRKISRCWRKANPGKNYKMTQRWEKANPEKIHAIRQRTDIKRRSTSRGKLNRNMGTVISRALRGNKKGRQWEDLVGYTVDQLKKHLEKLFKPDMTWENYGEWHIDHKIPISVFNFKTPEDLDFKRCWELKNLQPLWAKDNLLKKAKIDKPFQPSLRIAIKKIKELPPIPCNSDNGQAGTSIPVPLESFGAGGSANDINR